MSDYVQVQVNEESLNMSSLASITGEIWFQIGEISFPELYWSDFIIVVLVWWLNALRSLELSRVGSPTRMMFMDGSFFVKVILLDGGELELEFSKERLIGNQAIYIFKCQMQELKQSLLKAAKMVLWKAYNLEWDTADIRNLKELVKK
jgi:hypothetical protein